MAVQPDHAKTAAPRRCYPPGRGLPGTYAHRARPARHVVPRISGASMVLDQAVAQVPADSPIRPALSRALRLVRRAVDEGRAAIRGVHQAPPAPSSLEEAFSNLLNEVKTGRGMRLRVFLHGKPQALNPAIQEQLFLIGREAVTRPGPSSAGRFMRSRPTLECCSPPLALSVPPESGVKPRLWSTESTTPRAARQRTLAVNIALGVQLRLIAMIR
jgi:hypothetical protein